MQTLILALVLLSYQDHPVSYSTVFQCDVGCERQAHVYLGTTLSRHFKPSGASETFAKLIATIETIVIHSDCVTVACTVMASWLPALAMYPQPLLPSEHCYHAISIICSHRRCIASRAKEMSIASSCCVCC